MQTLYCHFAPGSFNYINGQDYQKGERVRYIQHRSFQELEIRDYITGNIILDRAPFSEIINAFTGVAFASAAALQLHLETYFFCNCGAAGGDAPPASDITPPVVVTATVDNPNPSKIFLTLDKVLEPSFVPDNTDFVVSGGKNVVSVSISGNTVAVVTDNVFNPGEVITLTYTAGRYPIQTLIGNYLANFVAAAVTNNLT